MSGKLFIKTHGCQMNEYDSSKMADVLAAEHGLELTENEAEADVILVNTCAIREKAQEKVFSQLGRWRQLKLANPKLVIGVGGCVASQEGENIIKRAPFVDMVFGPQTLHRLPQMVDRVRSEGRAQEGISFLLIDMTTPGVRVRPIIMLDGTHEVNEVWFEDVRVPVANLVGEENRGWTYAKFLLGHERTGIAEVGRSKSRLKRLKAIASQQPGSKGKPLIDDSRFRDRIAQVEIDLMALEITNLRVVAADRDKKSPGPAASLLKVKGTEIQQSISELLMQTMDHYALAYQPEDGEFHAVGPDYGALLSAHYLNYRKVTIYGGSNEIQRNIVAKMILGF